MSAPNATWKEQVVVLPDTGPEPLVPSIVEQLSKDSTKDEPLVSSDQTSLQDTSLYVVSVTLSLLGFP
jgi:hypothetical protein